MVQVHAVKKLQGSIRPPSDKSLTHRALMFGSIARGKSEIRQPLMGHDCIATEIIVQQLGARVERVEHHAVSLSGATLCSPQNALDCGNSGTTMRLMCGLLAGRGIDAMLIGDASLSKRPMRRVVDPLTLMGASIQGDNAPLTILAVTKLRGIDYTTPVASAQIKSAILLAGLTADGATRVTEPSRSRDHTERMLSALGAPIEANDKSVTISQGWQLPAFSFEVPADISSAAFWMVAAGLIKGSEVEFRDIGINPTRSGILDVFGQIGISVHVANERAELGEPLANIAVQESGARRPFIIEGDLVPRLVDEIPVLAVMATQLEGTSIIRNASELRVKESDRIESVAKGLRDMGAKVDTFEDGMAISGPTPLHGAHIEADLDHRIAMAFTIAGLIAEGETTIGGAESVDTSYPDFFHHLDVLSHP